VVQARWQTDQMFFELSGTRDSLSGWLVVLQCALAQPQQQCAASAARAESAVRSSCVVQSPSLVSCNNTSSSSSTSNMQEAALMRARSTPPTTQQAPKKKVPSAPMAVKKTVKKETNPLYEKRPKNFGA